MPVYSSKPVELSRGSTGSLGGDRLPVSTGHPKTAEQTPQAGLSYLLLQPVQPLPHADKLLHIRLVVLQPEPFVGPPVHPLGLLGERLRHVRTTAESLP